MNIYQENGYESREDYLQCLADDYGVPYESVLIIADLLGESEMFDGLVSFLSVNGCRTEIDPANTELRIRDGIRMLVKPALARAEAAEEELRKAREQEPVAWMLECQGWTGENDWILSWSRSGAGVCNRLNGESHEQALYAAPKPAALPYLCDGKRFKISINGEGGTYCFDGHPELDGKWVVLVDATDNQHMQAPKPVVSAVPAVPSDEQIHSAYREALGQSIRERDMPEIRKFARALLGAKP